MGQWGKSYEIEDYYGGILLRKILIPHHPGITFSQECTLKNIIDSIVCIDEIMICEYDYDW